MSRPSSSTSSSEEAPAGAAGWRDAAIVGAWMIVGLVVIDLAINAAIAPLRRPPDVPPHPLYRYFDYGRSVEGKLRALIGPDRESTGPLAFTGWPEDLADDEDASPGADDELLVAVYGMSFSNQAARAMAELDPSIALRLRAGPGAPANHSYAVALMDRENHRADVAVLGVLASSVRAVDTVTGMTWMFEAPAPFTYPRYVAEGGALRAIEPGVRSLDELRRVMADPGCWDAFVGRLERTDAFYDPFLFRGGPLDRSALVRLVRRAWWGRHNASRLAAVHDGNGFIAGSSTVASLRRIVASFAAAMRRDGRVPVVLLLHDRGFGDDLYRALEPTLEEADIPFLSTHALCPADEPANFIADGHFTPECNRAIGRALLDEIRRALRDRRAGPDA